MPQLAGIGVAVGKMMGGGVAVGAGGVVIDVVRKSLAFPTTSIR